MSLSKAAYNKRVNLPIEENILNPISPPAEYEHGCKAKSGKAQTSLGLQKASFLTEFRSLNFKIKVSKFK